MDDDQKYLLKRIAAGFLVLLVIALGLRWLFRSDEVRISEAVEAARDALVEKRTDDFLAAFTDDMVYRGDGDLDDLKRDLNRWIGMGIVNIYIVSEDITVDGFDADIDLIVAAGPQFTNMGQVNVELEAEKGEDDVWRVRSFDWKRR